MITKEEFDKKKSTFDKLKEEINLKEDDEKRCGLLGENLANILLLSIDDLPLTLLTAKASIILHCFFRHIKHCLSKSEIGKKTYQHIVLLMILTLSKDVNVTEEDKKNFNDIFDSFKEQGK